MPRSNTIFLLLLTALVAVSTSSLFARFLPGLAAVSIAFWRMAVASTLLWSWTAIKPQSKMSRTHLKKTLLAGMFLGFHFACFFGALKLTSVANATVFATMAPIFTALIERFYLRRRWNVAIIAGLLLSVVGGILINTGGYHFAGQGRWGDGLALLSSLWMALVLLIAEDIRQDTGTIAYSRLVYSIAGVTLFLIALVTGVRVFQFEGQDILWLFLLGLIPTVVGHTLFSYAVKFIRPTVVASVPLGEPVIASLLAWIFLAEPVPGLTIAGGVITLTGLALITRNQTAAPTDFQIDTL
ncbi:MAG: DMT family transporter [Candidatus Neomarinimicrobiota bacterium]|nr:MAG: DMT family transporter [Candidatus Neomarinimicrobiota bacterium]